MVVENIRQKKEEKKETTKNKFALKGLSFFNWSTIYLWYQYCIENISPPSEENIIHYLLCLYPNTLNFVLLHL